jgi:hypothetical protein
MIGGGGGTPGGTNAGLFLPPGQAQVAQAYGQLNQPLFDQGMNALNMMGGVSPAMQAYPFVQSTAQNILNNPFQQGPLSGGTIAQELFQNQMLPQGLQSGGILQNLGQLSAGQAGAIPGMVNNPAYGQAQQYGNQFAPQLMQAGQSILNTGFDPQSALYNRTLQQVQDQQNAINARSGVQQTPYGAGITGDASRNFNIDWQNQQLQRQALAGPTAASLFGNAQQGLMGPANQQLAAAGTGANTIDALIRGAGQGLTGAQGLYGGLAQAAPGMMGAPYNAFNQVQGSNFGALQNMINLGNTMYQPASQVASNLSNYMGLGQRASELANTIGQTNFNEAMQTGQGITQGLGALGSSNLLFGSGGISNALGLGSGGLFGSLFGGGAGAGAGAGELLGGIGAAGDTGAGIFSAISASPELALPFALGAPFGF